MPALTVVILAAGQGTRMRSSVPKMLHDLCGRPLVGWPIAAAQEAGADTIVVVDSPANTLDGHLPEGVRRVVQPEPDGTGGAVQAAAAEIDDDATVVVLTGDAPLVTATAIAELVAAHAASGASATMVTMELDDPAGYGRVVRDSQGAVVRVVETKADGDAPEQERRIREVNSGIFAFDGTTLKTALAQLRPDNAQGELYLPDVLTALRDERTRGRGARARRPQPRARRQRPRPARAGARDRPGAHPRRARPRRRDDRRSRTRR